jgi:hypothetical protein
MQEKKIKTPRSSNTPEHECLHAHADKIVMGHVSGLNRKRNPELNPNTCHNNTKQNSDGTRVRSKP